ncbi:MAG: cation:proton antiporter, partial [Patescibacteria group bacterium]|nr:cation:proton antiporter [Patescibacteria group bacterium]
MSEFLLSTLSLIGLLTVASYAYILAQKIRIPYTVILFIIGVALVFAGNYIPFLHFLTHLELSKEMVFYIFLPTLIFESAYNMHYKKILGDSKAIFALSVFGLLISTLIIGIVFKLALGLIGIDIPYFISFLFGAIISATDPVAVLSIFKEYGVPKRLSYLFEGESLINDGTAVALFLIILEMTMSGVFGMDSVLMGVYTFTTMLVGGILYGLFAGFFFSKVLQYVRNNMWVEITITLIMAHTTFITAELISEHFNLFQLSPIIATTVGALVLGNYGKYKISPKVEHMMDNFWGYFGFISNSLIFLLMGILIARLDINFASMILPIIIAIVVVAV